VSAVTEAVSRFQGLGAEFLLRGVRTLVDTKNNFNLWRSVMPKWLGGRTQPPDPGKPARVATIMSHPLVASSAKQASPPSEAGNSSLTSAQRRQLPSYISGQIFARVLTDILPPEASAKPAPVGWGDLPACATRQCSWLARHGLTNVSKTSGIDNVWAFLLVLLGWALTIGALTSRRPLLVRSPVEAGQPPLNQP
jgi:hypothetical protein